MAKNQSAGASKKAAKPTSKDKVAKQSKNPKAKKFHKYTTQKVSNKAKAKQAAIDGLKKGNWETVKIAGNLLTDDGGGLEGLIGLEVLEDYGAEVVKTSGKRTYSENDIDEDFALLTKAERKQKRLEVAAKESERKEAKKAKLQQQREKVAKAPKAPKVTPLAQVSESDSSDVESEEEDQVDEDADDDVDEDISDVADESDEGTVDEIYNEDDVSDIEMEDDEDSGVLSADDLVDWKPLGVHELILKALAEKNFRTPTEIQSLTLPAAILGKKDILGAAETGSGKTLAFGIPILNGILQLKEERVSGVRSTLARKVPKALKGRSAASVDVSDALPPAPKSKKELKRLKKKKQLPRKGERDNMTPPPEELHFAPDDGNSNGFAEQDIEEAEADGSENGDHDADDYDVHDVHEQPLYALVLTPTRELCVQVKDHLVQAAKYTGIQVAAIFGGLAHVKQERVLRKCPEIVVATPGRLWELIRDGNEHLNKLRDIK